MNESIDEALLQAEIELEATTSYSASTQEKLKNVGNCIAKGRQLIANRQKLIKIADRSDLGWAVVEEYTADELAADSDDEKRLDKAERSAERKAAKRRKHTDYRHRPNFGRRQQPLQTQQTMSTAPVFPDPQAFPGSTPFPSIPPKRPPVSSQFPRVIGPCYACGQIGHLWSSCPRLTNGNGGSKTWYPPLIDSPIV